MGSFSHFHISVYNMTSELMLEEGSFCLCALFSSLSLHTGQRESFWQQSLIKASRR